MVAYSERIPNRFSRLNLNGYVNPNGHLENIQVNYASVQYANFNDNENLNLDALLTIDGITETSHCLY